MSPTPRQTAVNSIVTSAGPVADEAPDSPADLFGSLVFGDQVQRDRLPRGVYQALRRTIERGETLNPKIADAVAIAMKDWAVENGATHFTHWFQPMTGLTAEKHDSFLVPSEGGRGILEFRGSELVQGEPDASSFPSGGIRATFEARGYTAWDPTSPAFLRATPEGATLMIPTVFCSWTGEALDTKTPLLRATEALDTQSRRLLGLLGEEKVSRVHATVGPEQEYFLVDRELQVLRPDLVSCGRSLFGARPPKGQELEDHYFGVTPRRVLAFMNDLERELWRVGIPARTRHNEVAPSQFEMAAVFEDGPVAVDHNMLSMEMIDVVAERHGLVALLHEKPYAGVNGSGKHLNWSVADDTGRNLLEPGNTPHDNLLFVVFLTAILRAVDIHQDLLRASIAHAGNDHRLGANEAPPAIISVFLGAELEGVIEDLVQGASARKSGGQKLQLGVSALPELPAHSSDRNRTSPFAFTGNKFEFRAVGSSQSLALPVTVLNTAVAESLDHIATELEQASGDRGSAAQEIVRKVLTDHQRILFSGDNYSDEWREEAKRRGLVEAPDTPAALELLAQPKNIELFERYSVLSRRELEARSNILFETYNHRIAAEAFSSSDLATTSVLPAALAQQERLANTMNATRQALGQVDLPGQEKHLRQIAELADALSLSARELVELRREAEELAGDPMRCARFNRDRVLPAMLAVRESVDVLERLVDDELWPLPKYRELLFVH
jgi:glutamine synthetase